MRWLSVTCLLAIRFAASAALLTIDFRETPEGTTPNGFESLLAGEGRMGSWAVIKAEVPPAMTPLSQEAPQTSVKPVLAQTDYDPTDERFPMLAYAREEFNDFTLTTRFRILGGEKEQMAGIAFRLQDPDNFYVIRVSALGQNIRFYKVVTGIRGKLIGPSLNIATNEWYELGIQCRGSEITCSLNGTPVMPPLQDTSFARGKIAFWTKSDSACQFDGVSVAYTPTVPLAKQILKAALDKYGRVVDLRLYVPAQDGLGTAVAASKHPEDAGMSGGKAEEGAIRDANIFVGKGQGTVTVVMPVRDRNGDPQAAAQIVMDSFPGQTDNNAVVRAKPIIKLMERMLQSSQDPLN
jgi:hypothetical protein